MGSFASIYDRAIERVGSTQALDESLPAVVAQEQLLATADHRFLSYMTRCIFRAGFAWKVIDKKWDDFESAFQQFDIAKNAGLSDEDLERLATDERIVRNFSKINAVRINARFIQDEQQQHASFSTMIANWPQADIVGLWLYLRENGARLGGKTGQFLLREMGKDTFMLTQDVMRCLIHEGVVPDDSQTSKARLLAVQEQFNEWHQETELPLASLSKICALAYS